jgi:hypothetical protein
LKREQGVGDRVQGLGKRLTVDYAGNFGVEKGAI